MLLKRLIICLDIRDGKVTKGVRFIDNREVGDPVELARRYYEEGVDEMVFYDIAASAEGRPIDIEMVRGVARQIFIPFTVGGGLGSLADMRRVLLAGAEKVSLNSLAVRDPGIIRQGAREFGGQCVVLGLDAKRRDGDPRFPSGCEVVIRGGRTPMGLDVVEWAKRAADLGAGEICLNSIDADGARDGYDLDITRRVAEAVPVPVVASGGAGKVGHLRDVLTLGGADAALIASLAHIDGRTSRDIKRELRELGVPMRQ
ncbi:MAG: imidazole glycerol phosphate synthase subunit HisF [Planctomycetota bacterium]|jgi:cyclase|nr:imidazole glycerol phosphate synthase subunit HisF [Planctomycetota bacterium]